MNNKVSCSIVRDLLPNYIDKLTEDETNYIIEDHLSNCTNCKLIYEEMSSEMEDNTYKNEVIKEKKIKDLLEKAKLGYIIKKVFKIIRILTIVLYLIMNGILGYVIFSNTQYFSITERNTIQNTMLLFSITFLIPSILILILFVKNTNNILKIIKGVIQLILLISLPFIWIIGLIISLRMPSSTTNPENYAKKEECVEELLNNQEFVMLPDTLPNNIVDVDYFYKYEVIFDDQYLNLEISWTYQDYVDYENEKLRMQSFKPINSQVVEDGFQMHYTLGNNKKDKQHFRFGYDDVTKRVTYRIYYEWVS